MNLTDALNKTPLSTMKPLIQTLTSSPRKSRIVVVDSVYYQAPGGQPVSINPMHSRTVESEEDPFIRRMVVGEGWVPLECGHIRDASLLVLVNEGTPRTVRPTEAEAREDADRVIEFGIATVLPSEYRPECRQVVALIFPKESARFTPSSLPHIRLRCRRGRVKVTVNIFPT